MATKIPIGTSAYFTSFIDGQGIGASLYYTYAEDQDTNFLLLRATINQLVDEISAISGPNAIAALDAFIWDDEFNPITAPEQKYGVVGAASYEVSIEGGSTTLECRKGQVYINGQRASLVSDVTGIAGFGGAGTLYVAVDVNGVPSIHDAADQKALDIASVAWNGAAFTGSVTHLADVFFDGDSWAYLRDRAVTPNVATFSAYTFREGASRIRAIELFLAGQDTGEEGEAIDGPFVLFPGSAALPSLVMGDGGSTIDTDAGWYRPGSGAWGFSSGGVLRYTFAATGILCGYLGTASVPTLRTALAGLYFPSSSEVAIAAAGDLAMRWKSDTNRPQALIADGVVGFPSLALDQDEDSGWYSPAAAEWALSLAGAKAFHFAAGYLRFPDGVVGAPAIAFESDPDTGFYTPGVGRLAAASAGVQSFELDAVGNLDLPTNFGAIVRRVAAQAAIATATPTQVSWDTEDRDIGAWIAVTATDLVVPTDGDGLYLITLEAKWDNIATPIGTRDLWIEAAGTIYGLFVYDSWVDRDHPLVTSTIVPLVATNIVRGIVQQSQAAPLDLLSARLAIQKIA